MPHPGGAAPSPTLQYQEIQRKEIYFRFTCKLHHDFRTKNISVDTPRQNVSLMEIYFLRSLLLSSPPARHASLCLATSTLTRLTGRGPAASPPVCITGTTFAATDHRT
ncbi:hypothetical protein E2C01_097370 [Portunus trituberculatus]|uniref:Uncharacterized protein n=1 Tax=Portunus trituberculatus TaxID=210409 RepID=A0A5B7KB34_PORTR|nr:hypothetical protein [Portunus trituberculatus]